MPKKQPALVRSQHDRLPSFVTTDYTGRVLAPRNNAFVFAAGLTALAAGCMDDSVIVTANEAEAKDNLALFEQEGPASYTYLTQRTCDCANSGEWIRTVVEDGEAVSAVTEAGAELETGATMPAMLESLIEWTKNDPLVFEATYDPDVGYLMHLKMDISEVEGNEFEIRVDCLAEGTGDDVCPFGVTGAGGAGAGGASGLGGAG